MIGCLMAEKWGLPDSLSAAIGHHHDDGDVDECTGRAFDAIRAVAPFRDEADPAEGLAALQVAWSELLGVDCEAVAKMVNDAQEEANKLAEALGTAKQGGQKAA
jgi:HD-like signal output (HDOD) protein